MALTIPIGYGVAAWEFTSNFGTPPFVTTCGVEFPADISAGFDDCAEALWDYYAGAVGPVMSNGYFITRCVLHVGQDGGAAAYESSHIPVNGGRGGNDAPAAMAPIARKISNTGGRKGRGRMFLPGCLIDGDVDQGGHLTPGVLTTLAPAVAQLFTFMTEGNSNHSTPLPPVILHTDGSTPSPVTGFALSQLVGWIHGRIY